MGPSLSSSVEPEAEKSGFARQTSASMGTCQRSCASARPTPPTSTENDSAPTSESATQTGCTAQAVTIVMEAKRVAGTAAWLVVNASGPSAYGRLAILIEHVAPAHHVAVVDGDLGGAPAWVGAVDGVLPP